MTNTGAGMPIWAYTGACPMRDEITTEGSTATGWAQPAWVSPRAKVPRSAAVRSQGLGVSKDMLAPFEFMAKMTAAGD